MHDPNNNGYSAQLNLFTYHSTYIRYRIKAQKRYLVPVHYKTNDKTIIRLYEINNFRHLTKDNSKHTKLIIIRTKIDSICIDK